MISELILKYLNNEATEEEVAIVFEWIYSSEENKATFIQIKQAWALTASCDNELVNIPKIIKKQVNRRKRFNTLKYAAVLVVLLSFGAYILTKKTIKSIPKNDVVLELANGTIKNLNGNHKDTIIDKQGQIIGLKFENEIVYTPKKTIDKISFNTIKIPYGKTFKLTLSDGTIVHLNAGTSFKFPEQFSSLQKREVYLSGEAFFEVSKNKELPFIVHSNQINIEVLGTVFNVSAYEDDASTHCELIEGSVRLSQNSDTKNQIILTPGFKATWNPSQKTFETNKVDTNTYISWVNGELIFNNAPFSTITKKLERSFNVSIINNNDFLAKQYFTGSIKIKDANIESLFKLFEVDTPFTFTKNENVIEIMDTN